ncbi:MAG: hypothetical protein V3V72_01400 [Ignavibacteriaceae bacterium]|jgi:hypothetical protein
MINCCKNVFFALLAGASVWIFDALLDYLIYDQNTFFTLSFVAPDGHKGFIRLGIIASFLFIGIIKVINKRVEDSNAGKEQ